MPLLAHGMTADTGVGVEPLALTILLVAVTVYTRGARALRQRPAGRRFVPAWRIGCAAVGFFVLIASLASSLHSLAEQSLSLHMVQHVLLLFAAPLLALGRAGYAGQAALSPGLQAAIRRIRSTATWRRWRRGDPAMFLFVTVGHVAALWAWHAPSLYDAALRRPSLHGAEHAFLLGSAVVFWMCIVRPTASGRLHGGFGVICLAAVLFQGGVLGALLAFAEVPLYEIHAGRSGATAAVRDQQVAGALMWVLPGFLYALAAAMVFVRWLGAVEDRRLRAEQPA